MANVDEITTYDDAIPLKFALENVLGSEEWYRLKDTRSVTDWRKSLLKALRSTDVAISASVQIADEAWRETACEILEHGRESIKDAVGISNLFSAFGACYMQFSFHQLGFMPRRKGKKAKIRATPANWNLAIYRSVQYVQSEAQKLRSEYSSDTRKLDEKIDDPKYRKLRWD